MALTCARAGRTVMLWEHDPANAERLKKKRERPLAIQLLRTVLEIEAWHFEATFDLARLLNRDGERDEARHLYEGLAERNSGSRLRRARGALLVMSPTPAALWRWARAATLGR